MSQSLQTENRSDVPNYLTTHNFQQECLATLAKNEEVRQLEKRKMIGLLATAIASIALSVTGALGGGRVERSCRIDAGAGKIARIARLEHELRAVVLQ